MPEYKVSIVIVTYGQRLQYLNQVIQKLLMQTYSVFEIIIVDNNSSDMTKQYLRDLTKSYKQIKIINLMENTGSAYGFKAGLNKIFNDSECDYIWLLDDDNMPELTALEILISIIDIYSIKNELIALQSLRIVFDFYNKIANGGDVKKLLGRKNSFLVFHFLDLPSKIYYKFKKNNITDLQNKSKLNYFPELPYSPYGGLLLHRDILNIIGLPNEQFFLYSDDHEFTHRIISNQGKILLIPHSKIIDIDQSWHGKQKFLPVAIRCNNNKDLFRIYYANRNKIYFQKLNLVDNYLIFYFNFVFYTIHVLISGIGYFICTGEIKYLYAMKNYILAIKDGLRGQLGKREFI